MSLPVQMLADRLQVVTCIHAHNLLAVPGLSYLLHVRVHLGSALVDRLQIGQVVTDDCHAE
jgi:hypothetical protein